MDTRELLLLVRWADKARQDDDFWRRLVVAANCYPLETQMQILNLVKEYATANGRN